MFVKIKPLTAGWILAIVYLVGFFGFKFQETKGIMNQLIWVNLLFTLIVLLVYHKKWNGAFVFSSILIGVCGYFLEVVGVKTGYIFGNYQYGNALGFKYWDTPIMMFVNWLTTVYITRQIAEQVTKDPMLHSFIAALLMVLLDYFIEPFAIHTNMWTWQNGVIPFQNYIGWFVSGFIFQYVYLKSVKFPVNKLSLAIYLIQLSFFIALYLTPKA